MERLAASTTSQSSSRATSAGGTREELEEKEEEKKEVQYHHYHMNNRKKTFPPKDRVKRNENRRHTFLARTTLAFAFPCSFLSSFDFLLNENRELRLRLLYIVLIAHYSTSQVH